MRANEQRRKFNLCTWLYTIELLSAESPNRPISHAFWTSSHAACPQRQVRERESSSTGVHVIIHTSWAPPEIQPVTGSPIAFQASGFPVPRQPIGFEISILPGPTSRAARSTQPKSAFNGPTCPLRDHDGGRQLSLTCGPGFSRTEFAIFIKERASELAPTLFPVLLSSRLT